MSAPVTARLDDEAIAALDAAVAAGIAENRSAAVAEAVKEWLSRHSEAAIVESYRRRYAEPEPEQVELVGRIAAYGVAACLHDGR